MTEKPIMLTSQYSRANPSPRFQALGALYKSMHAKGDTLNEIPADQTFAGVSLPPHVQAIGALLRAAAARTLLDYGSGKGQAYEHAESRTPDGRVLRGLKQIWGLDAVTLYDPGYEPYSALPTGQFDAVISTDVLEHCPEEDLDWIMAEIFGYATRLVYVCIACYPAGKVLPTGENAHITLKSPGWWVDKLIGVGAGHPSVRWYATIELTRGTNIRLQGPQ
jgi:hypothetical protein